MKIKFTHSRKKLRKQREKVWFRDKTTHLSAVGELFADARAKCNMTLQNASKATGLSDSNISQIETGRVKHITLKQAVVLCDLYKMDWTRIINAQKKELNEN